MKSRTAILFLHVIIISVSLLTSIKVVPGPDQAGILLAFYVLLFLPGLLLSRLLSSEAVHPLEGVCRIFTLGIAYESLVVCLGFVPGISYRGIAFAGAGITVVLLIADFVSSRRAVSVKDRPSGQPAGEVGSGGRRERASWILILVLVFAACFVLFSGSGEMGLETDAPDHISYVRRSLDGGGLLPRDSFYRSGDGVVFDPRKGIWHPVLGLWAFQADAPVEALWRALPAFLSFFALIAFIFFAWQLLGSISLVIPACMFLLLFFRGEGIGWFTKIAFSRNVAQVLLWCELAFLIRYYQNGKNINLLLVFLLILVGTAVHLEFSLLLAAAMIGVLIFAHASKGGRRWRRRFWASVPVSIIAGALPLALRAFYGVTDFNVIHTHRQGMMLLGAHLAVVDPAEVIMRFGTGFLFGVVLAPFTYWIAPQRKVRSLIATMFIVPSVMVLLPYTAVPLSRQFGYLYYRILYAAPLMCLLVIGLSGLLRIAFAPGMNGAEPHQTDSGGWSARPSRGSGVGVRVRRGRHESRSDRTAAAVIGVLRRAVALAAVAVFVWFPLRFGVRSFAGTVHEMFGGAPAAGEDCETLLALLDRETDPYSVIVADPETSYFISAYTDHFVTVILDQHCSPADTAALDRIRAVRDLFSPAVPMSAGVGWLHDVEADYVVLNMRLRDGADFFDTAIPEALSMTGEKFRSCPEVLRRIASADGFILFEIVDTDSTGGGAACTEPLAHPLPCRRTVDAGGAPDVSCGGDADIGISLDNFHIPRSVYAAGDTITGSVCWRVAGTIEFGLPVEWTIRLDTEFPTGPFFRPWYGKLYRRRIERQGGVLYRLTRTYRVVSGIAQPDQWGTGAAVRQEFSLVIPRGMAPGDYEVKVSVRRAAYIPNRTIHDYFVNEDSLDGETVAGITIVVPHAQTPSAAPGGARRGSESTGER